MALRKGGPKSVKKLIDSASLGTIELSTGIQISGVFTNVIEDKGKSVYIQTTGKTALCYRNKELVGHGTINHVGGFGSPIGMLKGINLAIEDMSPRDLKAYDIYESEIVTLEFEGGIVVSGEIVTGSRNLQGEIILITFTNCTVTQGDTILFHPEWGNYDMAVGKKIVSAFSGPADVSSFDLITHKVSSQTIKASKTEMKSKLESWYQKLRDFREEKISTLDLDTLLSEVKITYPNDWLLSLEIAEVARNNNEEAVYEHAVNHLKSIQKQKPKLTKLITDGLLLIQETNLV
jgi:phenylalanine-4-hydroxylase